MVIRDEFGPSLAGEKCPDLLQEDTQTEGRCRQKLEVYKCPVSQAGKRSALVRKRRADVSEAEEDLERRKEEVTILIATIYNKLETTRAIC